MNEDLSHICRLCLQYCEFKFSLFTGSIIHQIESLTSIKVTEDDRLPKSCCESCVANIYISYKFQQCIIESDRKLQEELALSEIDIIEETKQSPQLFEIMYLEDNSQTGNQDSLKLIEPKCEDVKDNLIESDGNSCGNDNTFMNNNEDNDCNKKNVSDEEIGITDSQKNDELKLQNEFLKKYAAYRKKRDVILKCSDCEVEFNSKRPFLRHMMKHKIEKCPFCSVTMRKDNLKRHMEIHADSPEICDICGKKAKNKESLRGHINYHHKNKALIQCESCGKEFKCKAQCTAHIKKVHLGIRNHQCDVCGKHFFGNYDLNKHINMTHKGARPYACQYCKKAFSSPYARKVHTRQHTNETPYRCEICVAGFPQKVSLITHLKSKHSVIYKNNLEDL
ncbi:hypothetical protein ILUMI_11531 [Ignelater luminosus]|uniref:Uncharacterized protein n=1 Tax=Ignelater luminosus TaxID=2038154 RepID=A0A8K0D184_IGNLU|nr:hypothetical protein ILUMI_11531 [Ignelater luminosus]